MLFLVVGTPWKRPRSSRSCCRDCDDGWFGGKSSTRTATLRMRLRNSCGSESSASSTTLAKRSRVIVHPLCSLRVAVVGAFIIIVVLIFPVVLFLFVLVWLLSKDDVGSNRSIRRG